MEKLLDVRKPMRSTLACGMRGKLRTEDDPDRRVPAAGPAPLRLVNVGCEL